MWFDVEKRCRLIVDTEFSFHRFEEFGPLDKGERDALIALGGPARHVKRHALIRAEGVPTTNFFLLIDGWVASSHTLANGSRQILKAHLPSDALGTPSMCMTHTVEELRALTAATVSTVMLDDFGKLFENHPRVAACFLLSVQRERVALMDRLASISRTSGPMRIAALILDLLTRLEPLGLVRNETFHMVLTQEQIGDIVGLTSVHTNRSLRTIEQAGLIVRSGQLMTVVDRAELARFALQPKRQLLSDLAWLPESRGTSPAGD